MSSAQVICWGLTFHSCDQEFDAGQMLELNLLLKPKNSKIKLQGCVLPRPAVKNLMCYE
jgi:hypothetical protein